jgi:hypothetical protein
MGGADLLRLSSDRCRWEELLAPFPGWESGKGSPVQAAAWPRRWTARWKLAGRMVDGAVADLVSIPVPGIEPVRRFSWRTSQSHRPGLQFMVRTGRHHGFESHAEQQLLLVLDFAGGVRDVVAQPFRFRFDSAEGPGEHIPDFLAVTASEVWLIDVRPGGRVEQVDRVRFAAAAEVALLLGWRYALVQGWRRHVLATVDTISSQRRVLSDPLGLQPALMESVARGAVAFGDLVAGTEVPAVARAQVLHLLWSRRLGVDLASPLSDRSLVCRAGVTR